MAKTHLSPELVVARNRLVECLESKDDQDNFALTLEDQLGIIDRLVKIEMLEQRAGKGAAGSALDDDEDDE